MADRREPLAGQLARGGVAADVQARSGLSVHKHDGALGYAILAATAH